jgi:hypothetical protein
LSDDTHEDDHWPRALRFLLERHPRATWPVASSPSVSFWLDVHDRLRHACAGLELAGDDYGRRRITAAQLAVIAPPRLRGLIASVYGHHQIEDVQYFPTFRRQEPRLAAGFDRLEREHAELAREVDAAVNALGELRAAAERPADSRAASASAIAARRYVAASHNLGEHLRRHLTAEEALVVPILLDYVEH